jgi:diguanylate cyclase (GGDEF)-like protein
LEPGVHIGEVAAMMHEQPDMQILPVVADGKPVGIVRRTDLLDILSLPLRYELYGNKPVDLVMDAEPLVVESDLKLDQVSRRVTHDKQDRLHEQFIVTNKGAYLGMARSIDLLRKITEEQIRAARYSNPLTSLPGNVPIYDCVNDLLQRERWFVLCYVDIDNFKPFNDYYGYGRGDDALMAVGRELKRRASPRLDFVGHVGGDDFVVVFRSPDWMDRITQAMESISKVTRELYDAEQLKEGGLVGRDRDGVERRFPLLSVSVAALICDQKLDCTAEDLASMIAPLKSRAKRMPGNALEIEHCSSLETETAMFKVLSSS